MPTARWSHRDSSTSTRTTTARQSGTALQPSSWHGVTTAVGGNCGVGFAPVKQADRDQLIELMEGVEDIPGTALHDGLRWGWESFGEYLDVLSERSRDLDFATQVPHAALRIFAMGERAVALEPATGDEIAVMARLAAEAVRAGALGFTTSRTLAHKTKAGAATRSTGAPTPNSWRSHAPSARPGPACSS
jgi:N-acyl-D-aspartate/D-glutamate deacylase